MSDNSFVTYAKYYDQLNLNKPYKQEIEFIYEWAGKPKSILDLGCGTASYWKHYPKNVKLKGIDASEHMISQSEYKDKIACDSIYFSGRDKVDCVTALFDVVNYTPTLGWMRKVPLKKNGYFIFDMWDLDKVNQDGFKTTERYNGDVKRTIVPYRNKEEVDMVIVLEAPGCRVSEIHKMYLHSEADLIKLCKDNYIIDDKKETKTWQTWYRLKQL